MLQYSGSSGWINSCNRRISGCSNYFLFSQILKLLTSQQEVNSLSKQSQGINLSKPKTDALSNKVILETMHALLHLVHHAFPTAQASLLMLLWDTYSCHDTQRNLTGVSKYQRIKARSGILLQDKVHPCYKFPLRMILHWSNGICTEGLDLVSHTAYFLWIKIPASPRKLLRYIPLIWDYFWSYI